jgi:hypothetical protein
VDGFLQNVVSSFVGGLLGSGSIWAYLSYKQHAKEIEVSSAISISVLQRDLLDKLVELIAKSKEYADIRDGKMEVAIPPNRLDQLQTQIDILMSDILSNEMRLANLEGREPRKIKVHYVHPTPPKNLRISTHEGGTKEQPNAK